MKSIYLHRWMLLWLVWLIPCTTSLLAEVADCDKPLDLTVSEVGENGVTLNWTSNGAHLDYKVEVRSKGRTSKLKWESQTIATSIRVEGKHHGGRHARSLPGSMAEENPRRREISCSRQHHRSLTHTRHPVRIYPRQRTRH